MLYILLFKNLPIFRSAQNILYEIRTNIDSVSTKIISIISKNIAVYIHSHSL